MAEGKPVLDTISINGINVDAHKIVIEGKTWEIQTSGDNFAIKTATIYLAKTVESLLVMNDALNGKSVTIQRGELSATEEYVFRGEVISVTPNGSVYQITCANKLNKLQKKKIITSFDKDIDVEAGVYSEIFKTIVNEVAGLTADATSVSNSGTTNVLTKFICRGSSRYERCKKLLETLGWQGGYDDINDRV
jgi:hypothetical protein